jgi:carbamoyl-phosphate synthase small subunit
VTPAEPLELDATSGERGPTIAMIDTGVKSSIVARLRARGARLVIHPCTSDARAILEGSPDAVMLVNGPGDPAALDYLVDQVRSLVGRLPMFGICLGHQLLCRAVGLETYKLRFGHRGANHPVKDLSTGRIEITSQNHGFAVLGPGGEHTIDEDRPVRWDTDFGTAELTHINLYDRTVEGLRLPEARASTVQYHPEAGPGPHDALHLFDRFITAIGAA